MSQKEPHTPLDPSPWWRDKKQWQDNSIRSSAKSNTTVLWGFALFWNVISYTPFIGEKNILDEIPRSPPAALVFLFPLVGLLLIAMALKSTREWRKYGKTPLTLDPFPGAIGGQCGGTITLSQALAKNQDVKATLSCRRTYYTGTGDNRRRTEDVLWQHEGYCNKQVNSDKSGIKGGDKTTLSFCFDIPDSSPGHTTSNTINGTTNKKANDALSNNGTSTLDNTSNAALKSPRNNIRPSEPDDQKDYVYWKVGLVGKFQGPDLIREYVIPVVHSDIKQSSLSLDSSQHPLSQAEADDGVYEIANIHTTGDGVRLYFPALRRPGPGIAWSIFGAVFTAAGLFAYSMNAPFVIACVSSIIGGGMLLGGLFNLSKSLRVNITSTGINTRRYVLGYPIKSRHLSSDKIKHIQIKQVASTQHGSTTTIIYHIFAIGTVGKKVILAERLNKRSEAERLKELYETYLGLTSSTAGPGKD